MLEGRMMMYLNNKRTPYSEYVQLSGVNHLSGSEAVMMDALMQFKSDCVGCSRREKVCGYETCVGYKNKVAATALDVAGRSREC